MLGTTITAVTASVLKTKKAKFAQMTTISANGSYFLTDRDEYRAEVRRQATKLHWGRHIPMNTPKVHVLSAKYRSTIHVRPDLYTAVRLAHTARDASPVDPRAPCRPGAPPTFHEM